MAPAPKITVDLDVKLDALRRAEIDELLGRFRFDHLPQDLQAVSRPFARMALNLVELLPTPYASGEIVLCLQHLMAAKDAAVRHAAGHLPGREPESVEGIREHLAASLANSSPDEEPGD